VRTPVSPTRYSVTSGEEDAVNVPNTAQSVLWTECPKAYDAKQCREGLRRRGIKTRIARQGRENSERLGRHRWVVERTFAWLARYRRLTVRYERRADIRQAFLYLGCLLICFRYLR
jgi:transposase